MSLKDKIEKYLGGEIEEPVLDEQISDDDLLDLMVSFIMDLNEDDLPEDMQDRLAEIVDALETEGAGDEDAEEDMEEGLDELRLLKKTAVKVKRAARLYYKKNKAKIKAKLKKLKPKIQRLRKMGKGLTGKKLGLTKRR